MWWWSGMRGRWEQQQEGGGQEEKEREENNIYFLSTNLKFEVYLEGEEEFTGPGQACKGHYCVHPVLARAL